MLKKQIDDERNEFEDALVAVINEQAEEIKAAEAENDELRMMLHEIGTLSAAIWPVSLRRAQAGMIAIHLYITEFMTREAAQKRGG